MAKEKLNLVDMTDDELRSQLASSEREYQQLKFDHAAKGIANPMEIRELRRNIARILTEGRRREIAAMSPDELALRTKIRARRRKNR
ncbi:MAG: 50S ribosomal protein L29 [Saprospiraceae bacterium]|nr:50S ribosomal protein L29 [Saprospiraceae bacterium]